MYEFQRICKFQYRAGHKALLGAGLVFSLLAGGCSTDVSRFDLGKYSMRDDGGATGSLPPGNNGQSLSDAPIPSQPMADQGSYRGRIGSGLASRNRRADSLNRRSEAPAPPSVYAKRLPDIAPASQGSSSPLAITRYRSASRNAPRVQDNLRHLRPLGRAANAGSRARAQTITVARGDTLYGLSRRYGVSIAALQTANGLRNTMIRPGQKLRLPGARQLARQSAGRIADQTADQTAELTRRRLPRRTPFTAPRQSADRLSRERSVSRLAAASRGGTYKVRPGDSIYRIAHEHGLRSADLLSANPGINPRRMRPGQILRLPAGDAAAAGNRREQRQVLAMGTARQAPRVVNSSGPRTYGNVKTRIINEKKKPTRVASLDRHKLNDSRRSGSRPSGASSLGAGRSRQLAKPGQRSSAAKFRWPVKGRMIAKFGSRRDGTLNDGINISVPKGTAVKAAENGVVAYAGNELKGYGNLILVRHEGNWVTAYAHNSELEVRRGDKVRRGEVIAKAGATGTVGQP